MYIWTAPGSGAASFRRATGVSDDLDKAREAAEGALRSGQAGTAYIERVYTATATPTLSFCYVRTGTGWWARVGQAGRITWIPYTAANGRQHAQAAALAAKGLHRCRPFAPPDASMDRRSGGLSARRGLPERPAYWYCPGTPGN